MQGRVLHVQMIRPFGRNERGAAAVEFAILGSIFIMMLIGIIAFGLYFTVAHGVQQVAAEAARAAVGGLSDSERGALAEARALEVVETYPFLQAGHLTVASQAVAGDVDLFQVTVTYDATHLGLSAFANILPLPPNAISRTSIVRRGGW